MYDIAEQVASWLDEGRVAHTAQVVATRGFSSRDPSAALAWTDDGQRVGALFPSLDDDLPATGSRLSGHLAELAVSDTDAVAAGLACGGVATVFVQNAASYPEGFWQRAQRREPLCLVSHVVADEPGTTMMFTPDDVRMAANVPDVDVPRLFARGQSSTALTGEGDTSYAVVTLWPTTTLLVVGDGLIAEALADIGQVLGWSATVTSDALVAAEVAGSLRESDAAVVLSHDRAVDVPSLAALLAGRAGYIGALGARRTQAARHDGLLGRDVPEDQLARIHGPAGLDIDAHAPGEIAVSIVAEVLATRSGASGGSISHRDGPVHSVGVNAPPPRY